MTAVSARADGFPFPLALALLRGKMALKCTQKDAKIRFGRYAALKVRLRLEF